MLLGFGSPFRWDGLGRWAFGVASFVRDSEDGRFEPRIVAEFVLVVALVFGGYLVGRFSAPDGIQMADENCVAASPATPVAVASTSQRPPSLVYAPRSAAPRGVAPPVAGPPAAVPTAPPAAPSTAAPAAPLITVPIAAAPFLVTALAPGPAGVTSVSISDLAKVELLKPTRALSNDEVLETQAWLKAFGFDPGPLDGLPGSQTAAAVKRYQAARHMDATGQLDLTLLRRVRQEAGHS
jgi:putative peptidoglycan binding protein